MPEPADEDDDWRRAQISLMLTQISRINQGMARDDHDAEARRREWEKERAECAATLKDTRRMLDQMLVIRFTADDEATEDKKWEREFAALREENARPCAEAGLEPGWLLGRRVKRHARP